MTINDVFAIGIEGKNKFCITTGFSTSTITSGPNENGFTWFATF